MRVFSGVAAASLLVVVAGLVVGFLTVTLVWLTTQLAWPWYAPIGTCVTVDVD